MLHVATLLLALNAGLVMEILGIPIPDEVEQDQLVTGAISGAGRRRALSGIFVAAASHVLDLALIFGVGEQSKFEVVDCYDACRRVVARRVL